MNWKRYIAAIMATYMFALMILPCNDVCNSYKPDTLTTFQTTQDQHQEEKDICSPFCFCSCCAMAIAFIHFPAFSFFPQYSIQDFSLLELAFNSNTQATIWQPPKISK
jgi:hypothetical protein